MNVLQEFRLSGARNKKSKRVYTVLFEAVGSSRVSIVTPTDQGDDYSNFYGADLVVYAGADKMGNQRVFVRLQSDFLENFEINA